MLDTITASLSSPTWWVTVFFGSIILQVVASRVDKGITKSTDNLLLRWRESSERKKLQRLKRVEILGKNRDIFYYYMSRVNLLCHFATLYYLMVLIGLAGVAILKFRATDEPMLLYLMYGLMALATMLTALTLLKAAALHQDLRLALREYVKQSVIEKNG
jgi:hypothetical protein